MLLRRAFLIALLLCFAAPSAFAQGMDDLLAPLTPPSSDKAKGKGKSKATRSKSSKASKRAKAGRGSKGSKSGKGSKQGPASAPEEAETAEAPSSDADLLAPLVKKTELLVKLNGVGRGARLFIDDKDVGLVPRGPIEVTPGEHTLVVRRPGYREFSRRVTVPEGESTEVSVLLEATAGFVSVKADVEGARVLINGEDKGVAPLDSVMLPAGSYEIVVQREGFRPESQRIAVRAGKEYTVGVNLRPEALAQTDQPRAPILTPSSTETPSPLTQEVPAVSTSTPLTKRWYFWAGVGAVVTAAAVGTVIASQPLDPDKVCGGTCDGVINKPTGGLFQF
ncbi:PEGA domain-containing protein [Archangium violaceum]|uniref:PEGA domain-containing protein n=1 Tax=Archangium violaceum TaxID=83451 RepID=UPI00193B3682|nr:PEGA domain-containing protein [Archangium violaceum]QRK04040.1 PEGA domain-containing protein [Archangium violaceum]